MKTSNSKKSILWLVLISVFALVLRTGLLIKFPPALNWDEVSHGYNAYSILKTGKDEWGFPYPMIFRAYGDYKLPIYIYIVTLTEAIMGINEIAVRLPSALAGTSVVVFAYLLAKKLFSERENKENIGLVAALLVAIEPWSLFVSRIAVEANLALAFIVAGIYFAVKDIKKTSNLIVSSLFFGLAVWTYNTARVFVPLIILCVIVTYGKIYWQTTKNKFTILLPTIVLLAFLVPMFGQLLSQSGQARYGWVKIVDEAAINEIIVKRNESKFPAIVTRLVYNRPTYFFKKVILNYLAHFNPKFLYLQGGSHYQFNVPNHGLLYIAGLPFFVVGILQVVKNSKAREYQLIGMWILIAPLASSITKDSPHTLRSLVLLPLPMLLTALGLDEIVQKFNKSKAIFVSILGIIFTLSFIFYVVKYLNYTKSYSWSWQYGYKQVNEYIDAKYSQYDKILITKKYGEPHEFILFYSKYDSVNYNSDPNLIRFYQTNWYWVDRFAKYHFLNDWEVKDLVLESGSNIDCKTAKCLLVTSPGNVPSQWTKLETIHFLSGEPAFEIYENTF